MENTRKVRVVMAPHQEIEVGPQEYLDLQRQGLLVTEDDERPAGKTPARLVGKES